MDAHVVGLDVAGPAQTAAVAAALAGRLVAGDVVLLTGDLAAGKTTFVKGVAEALGATDPVTSPTFALAQFYEAASAPILHVDAYRLDGPAEYRDLGLAEFVDASITLVEWGDRIAGEFPCHLLLAVGPGRTGPDSRTIELSSPCDRWAPVLDALARDREAAR